MSEPPISLRDVKEREYVCVCADCDGRGYWIGHADACWMTGFCECRGVQWLCALCGGSGIGLSLALTEGASDARPS